VNELNVLRRLLNLLVVLITVMFTTPSLMILATFVTQTAILHRKLSASTGFTTMALMEQFRASLTTLPWVGQQLFMVARLAALPRGSAHTLRFPLSRGSQAAASLKRMNEFLDRSEVTLTERCRTSDISDDESVVVIDRASFNWGQQQQRPAAAAGSAAPQSAGKLSEPLLADDDRAAPSRSGHTLSDISIRIRKGQLVCVYGVTGGGKSSLLSAILGEIYKTSGSVVVKGSIAYTPQKVRCRHCRHCRHHRCHRRGLKTRPSKRIFFSGIKCIPSTKTCAITESSTHALC
jgi:ABC-type multidrug transport system fused ATPase/permease subunit